MTNADRIRKLSDEGLARFLPGKREIKNCPPGNTACGGECERCWLEWLQRDDIVPGKVLRDRYEVGEWDKNEAATKIFGGADERPFFQVEDGWKIEAIESDGGPYVLMDHLVIFLKREIK